MKINKKNLALMGAIALLAIGVYVAYAVIDTQRVKELYAPLGSISELLADNHAALKNFRDEMDSGPSLAPENNFRQDLLERIKSRVNEAQGDKGLIARANATCEQAKSRAKDLTLQQQKVFETRISRWQAALHAHSQLVDRMHSRVILIEMGRQVNDCLQEIESAERELDEVNASLQKLAPGERIPRELIDRGSQETAKADSIGKSVWQRVRASEKKVDNLPIGSIEDEYKELFPSLLKDFINRLQQFTKTRLDLESKIGSVTGLAA